LAKIDNFFLPSLKIINPLTTQSSVRITFFCENRIPNKFQSIKSSDLYNFIGNKILACLNNKDISQILIWNQRNFLSNTEKWLFDFSSNLILTANLFEKSLDLLNKNQLLVIFCSDILKGTNNQNSNKLFNFNPF